MGNAKARGTREERIAQSIARREVLEAERLRLVAEWRGTNLRAVLLPAHLWPYEWHTSRHVTGWQEVVKSHE